MLARQVVWSLALLGWQAGLAPAAVVPARFRHLLAKLAPDTAGRVQIARAEEQQQLPAHLTLARVIQHNSPHTAYARTIVIQNTPQAHRAFGVRNVPSSWTARHKRRIAAGPPPAVVVVRREDEEELEQDEEEAISEELLSEIF